MFECFNAAVFVEVQVGAKGFAITTGQLLDLSGLQSFGSEINGIATFHDHWIGMVKPLIIQFVNILWAKMQGEHEIFLEAKK